MALWIHAIHLKNEADQERIAAKSRSMSSLEEKTREESY